MILSRPKILPAERFDLEDLNALLAAARSDQKLYTKQFLGSLNYILKGFSISGIGLTSATMHMTDATLMIPQNSFDFSWFVAAPSDPDITIPGADFTDGQRNYVEVSLGTLDGTPLTRAFWDPEANNGDGAEFNQIIDTVTDLEINVIVSTGGFSGLPDRLPIAIVDVDGGGTIKTIFDRRELYFRLSKPEDLDNEYTWGTKVEPTYALNLSGVSGVFVAGEALLINTEDATCVAGGTTSITFNSPTGINFFPGSTVTGLTSGATGTINTVLESFAGVDKSISNMKNLFDAFMTEIKVMKNTKYWWQDAQNSLGGLASFLDSLMVQAIIGASFLWDGNNFVIQDDTIMAPAASDVLGYIRLLGRSDDYGLCRQDGTGGSVVVPVAEKQVVYVKIPEAGTSRDFSGVGTGDTQFNVVDIGSFVPSDRNYWLCYRELNRLYIRGYGELEIGESVIIDDPMKENLQQQIDAINAILDAPSYDENLHVVSPTSSGSVLTIPVNSRVAGTPQQMYVVGKGSLQIFLNGQLLVLGDTNGWTEVGSLGADSSQITINQDLVVGDVLTYRIGVFGGPTSAGGGGGAPDDNFVTLPTSTVADNADFILIWDTSISAYRKQTRAVMLTGTGAGVPAPITLTADGNIPTTTGLILIDATSGVVVATVPDPATCPGQEFDIVKIDASANKGEVDGDGFGLSGFATFDLPGQWDLLTIKSTGTTYVIK